jgi:hypothetical protein
MHTPQNILPSIDSNRTSLILFLFTALLPPYKGVLESREITTAHAFLSHNHEVPSAAPRHEIDTRRDVATHIARRGSV